MWLLMVKKKTDKEKFDRITFSLSKKDSKQLRDLAEEEHRAVSNQLVHMMEFYLKNKDKMR
jgi:hypothetical protein